MVTISLSGLEAVGNSFKNYIIVLKFMCRYMYNYWTHNFSIGGGFFQGICAIMCGCETFEEAIELASRGDNKNVDKLVKDIYGSGYDQMGLPGDVIAAR